MPTKVTDADGNEMRYAYDNQGRTQTITGPKELANGQSFTIHFKDKEMLSAMTEHYTKTIIQEKGVVSLYIF